jgi:hypothetical protein
VSCVAAAGRPDEPRPGGDDEHRVVPAGLNCSLQLDVNVIQGPLRGNNQLANDVEAIVA